MTQTIAPVNLHSTTGLKSSGLHLCTCAPNENDCQAIVTFLIKL